MAVNKKRLVTLGLSLLATSVLMAADDAGNGFGAVADQLTAQMEGVTSLITSASYVAGLAFVMGGFFKIKAHKDNPVQEPLSKGLSMLLLGGCLFYLPSMMDVAGSSLLGADKSTASVTGTTEIS